MQTSLQNFMIDTEYTPDTEAIRIAWTHGFHGGNHNDIRVEYTDEEFDRWLANYTCDVLYAAASRLNSYHPAWEQLHDMAEQAREKGVMREH